MASRIARAVGLAMVLSCLPALPSKAQDCRDDDARVDISPAPPKGTGPAGSFPATTSSMSLAATFPRAAIAKQLENAIPRSFHFDVNSRGARAFGTPSRGPITVSIDPVNKRVSASTPVSGRVQVEKRVIIDLPLIGRINRVASVGIDVSGVITASLSPVIGPKWEVNPRLALSAKVNRAVAKTFLGDIDVTGHVQGSVGGAVNGVKGSVNAKLREAMDLRRRCERLWNEMNTVRKLSDDPPTWLRITPRRATFGQFRYTADSIESGLSLDLEARAFVQDEAPAVLKAPFRDLIVGEKPGDEFSLSLPIEIPHSVVSRQLKSQLMRGPIDLPGDVSVVITDASAHSFGDGLLLTLDFSARQGPSKSASGRLYVRGVPTLDVAADEVRLGKLALTAETRDALDENAGWLARADLPGSLSQAVAIKLRGALSRVREKATEQLDSLRTRFPREFAVKMSMTDLHVVTLAFDGDRTFAVAVARGRMSAVLRP